VHSSGASRREMADACLFRCLNEKLLLLRRLLSRLRHVLRGKPRSRAAEAGGDVIGNRRNFPYREQALPNADTTKLPKPLPNL
jgi:hypothetical protein